MSLFHALQRCSAILVETQIFPIYSFVTNAGLAQKSRMICLLDAKNNFTYSRNSETVAFDRQTEVLWQDSAVVIAAQCGLRGCKN